MEPNLTDVKPRRRYDSTGRRAHAQRNRDAVLDAAERQFLATGYAATTIASIAAEARVSVETVYKAFGGKPGLVREIYERGLTGPGPVPSYERSDEMRERETDPKTIMRNWGVLTTEVAAKVTPIRLLMRAAADTDPEIAAVLRQAAVEQADRMRHHAEFLASRGYLRSGMTVERATDILFTCSSVEIYEVLVLQRGWSPGEFARFVGDFMIATLLGQVP